MYILLLVFLTALNCCYDPPDIPYEIPDDLFKKPVCDSTLKVVWQKIVRVDSVYAGAHFFQGPTDIWYYLLHDTVGKIGIINTEQTSGADLLWETTTDYIDLAKDVSFVSDKLIQAGRHRVLCFNNKGDKVWEIKFDGSEELGKGSFSINSFGNSVYYPSRTTDSTISSKLFEIDGNTGNMRLLFEQPWIGAHRPRIHPATGYMLNNDTIAAFQIRYWNWKTNLLRSDIVAWNTTKMDTLWRLNDIAPYGQGSANFLIYENGKIYFIATYDILCFDAATGETLWKQSFENHHFQFTFSDVLLTEKGLVVKSLNMELALLNKETGVILWQDLDLVDNGHQLLEYKGDLYMSSVADGAIYRIDLNTGRVIWRAVSPNECLSSYVSYGNNHFVIDPKTGLLYAADNYFIQCLKMPDIE